MSQARTVTDHDEIRRRAEKRGGRPSVVQTGKGEGGILRFDFGEDDEKLEGIDWDQFFRLFEENNLTLLVQDKTADGKIAASPNSSAATIDPRETICLGRY
jgi:hypothetical protein